MTHATASVPLCAAGLRLVVEPITAGRLAPAITLRVYAGRVATSVGASIPAGDAEALAAAIVAAGRAAEVGAVHAVPTSDPETS